MQKFDLQNPTFDDRQYYSQVRNVDYIPDPHKNRNMNLHKSLVHEPNRLAQSKNIIWSPATNPKGFNFPHQSPLSSSANKMEYDHIFNMKNQIETQIKQQKQHQKQAENFEIAEDDYQNLIANLNSKIEILEHRMGLKDKLIEQMKSFHNDLCTAFEKQSQKLNQYKNQSNSQYQNILQQENIDLQNQLNQIFQNELPLLTQKLQFLEEENLILSSQIQEKVDLKVLQVQKQMNAEKQTALNAIQYKFQKQIQKLMSKIQQMQSQSQKYKENTKPQNIQNMQGSATFEPNQIQIQLESFFKTNLDLPKKLQELLNFTSCIQKFYSSCIENDYDQENKKDKKIEISYNFKQIWNWIKWILEDYVKVRQSQQDDMQSYQLIVQIQNLLGVNKKEDIVKVIEYILGQQKLEE